jgi:hypothetical protein
MASEKGGKIAPAGRDSMLELVASLNDKQKDLLKKYFPFLFPASEEEIAKVNKQYETDPNLAGLNFGGSPPKVAQLDPEVKKGIETANEKAKANNEQYLRYYKPDTNTIGWEKNPEYKEKKDITTPAGTPPAEVVTTPPISGSIPTSGSGGGPGAPVPTPTTTNVPTPVTLDSLQAGKKGVSKKVTKETLGEVQSAIREAAKETGISEQTLTQMAAAESGFNPNIVNKIGASGLFQFLTGPPAKYDTWTEVLRKKGMKYNFGLNTSPLNPRANALMAGEYAKMNFEEYKSVSPHNPPEATDIYIAHWLGGHGAKKFFTELKKDPNQLTVDIFGRNVAYQNAPYAFGNEGKDKNQPFTCLNKSK